MFKAAVSLQRPPLKESDAFFFTSSREGDPEMPKVLEPGQPYAGRAAGVVPVNLTLDKDAYELLQQQAPAKAERRKWLAKLTGVLEGEGEYSSVGRTP